MLAFVYLAYVGWPFISISDGASFFSPWIWTLASDIEVCSTKQVQAGKGINISARTFHLAQGDILKVCSPSPTGIISQKKKKKNSHPSLPYHLLLSQIRFTTAKTTRPMSWGPSPARPCWAWLSSPLPITFGWSFTVTQKPRGKDSNWSTPVSSQQFPFVSVATRRMSRGNHVRQFSWVVRPHQLQGGRGPCSSDRWMAVAVFRVKNGTKRIKDISGLKDVYFTVLVTLVERRFITWMR